MRIALVGACALAAVLVYLKAFVFHTPVGTTFVLVLTALASFGLLALHSLRAYGTARWDRIGNLWLAGFSAAATYACLDVATGWWLAPGSSSPIVADPIRHHRLAVSTVSRIETSEYGYTMHVDRLGLRGKEIAASPPPGTRRILMLGDSFTMGKGVGDDQTFSAVLERSLGRATAETGIRYQVLNGGVDSYAPVLSLLQLRELAPEVHPYLVILDLDMSDPMQENAYRSLAIRDAKGEIVAVPVGMSIAMLARSWIERHLYFTSLLMRILEGPPGRKRGPPTVHDIVTLANPRLLEHTLTGYHVDRRALWHNAFASILGIASYCRDHGFRFMLAIYPWGHQVGPNEWRVGRRAFMPPSAHVSDASIDLIRSFAAKHHIALIDAFPAFRAYSGRTRLYYDRDLHWTPAGHRLMASVIERALEARGVLSVRQRHDDPARRR